MNHDIVSILLHKSVTSYFAIAIAFCTLVLNCPSLLHNYFLYLVSFSID